MEATAHDLRVGGRSEPLGVDAFRPLLSWRLPAGIDRGSVSVVQISTAPHFDDLVWEGRTAVCEGPEIAYAGMPLESRRRYWWRVAVTDELESSRAWSTPAWFETGILDDLLWHAQWVTECGPAPESDDNALHLRTEEFLDAPVVRARAYVSALGWYKFFVNGSDVTGPALVPRWTPFDDYVEYQTYDVTAALRQGTNVLAMAIGDGRYRGSTGVFKRKAVFGDRLAGYVQLEVELEDGTTRTWTTDAAWKAGPGPLLSADPVDGERVDLRLAGNGWQTHPTPPPGYRPVHVLPTRRRMIAEEVPPVTEVGRLHPQRITRSPSGKQIVDFGQNFAGVVRVRLRGAAGTRVALSHSEVLTPDGELDTNYVLELPNAAPMPQRDEVILDGSHEWWQPWFTVHGFRFAQIDGLATELEPADVEGVVLSSDIPSTGHFECSDERLNALHRNVRWSMSSNFADTPTDCPTRERSGWTADIDVFAPAATTFADVRYYLRRYLRNLANDQLSDGRVPVVIPNEYRSGWYARLGAFMSSSVGWGDTAVTLPWTLYHYYGDAEILERQYPSMTAWVDQLAARARSRSSLRRRPLRRRQPHIEEFVCDTGFLFGEWLRPDDKYGLPRDLWQRGAIATAYLEHSARTVASTAGVLGKHDDAARYGKLADNARRAWRAVYLQDDGRIGSDRQDDYVRAISFDLLDEDEKPRAVNRLVELIEKADGHLGTGFLSTPMLLPVLRDGGRPDVAHRLLTQTTSPSWLYQVERGATTIWETWRGHDATGKATNSHNHYAFGAVAAYLTEHLAGITPGAPGYRIVDIRPSVVEGLSHVRAGIGTPYGPASSAWERNGDVVTVTATIPPGASGRIHTPTGTHDVGDGTFVFRWSESDSAA